MGCVVETLGAGGGVNLGKGEEGVGGTESPGEEKGEVKTYFFFSIISPWIDGLVLNCRGILAIHTMF